MKVLEITKENYESEVQNYKGKVFIDFYADWCGPCRMMSPIVDELSETVETVKFVKINVDHNEDVARSYGIMSIPTFVVLENGEIKGKHIGGCTKEELEKMI